MASTEELEAQILAEMEANPEAYADTGTEYCTVDDDTRLVTVPYKCKKLGVESDEKAKRIWFRFPKIVGNNGVDLSTIGVRVNFRNANGEGDIYMVEDLTVDGDYVIFSWELTRKVTAYKGHVSFVVCAVKSATDGTIKNEWNTTLNKECEVLEGLEVTEQIGQENPDIIEYILANLGGGGSGGTGLSTEAIDKLEEVGNYLAYTTADGGSKWTELIAILRNGSSGGGSGGIVPATGITLDKTTLSFTDSTSQTLVATVEPSDTTDKVVWTSNAESVATVTNGVVKPLSNGSATITATCGSVSATCSVTVDMAGEEPVTLTSISATYTGGEVAVGTALTSLTGITVTGTYSDGSTANITGYELSGEIVEGSNTITVSYGGKTTTFTVTGIAESSGGTTGVSNETTWTDGVPYTFDWVKNEYVAGANSSGSFKTYNGWNRSPYLYCDGASTLDIHNPFANSTGYNAFYDADKNYISSFNTSKKIHADWVDTITVPENAVYFAVSYDASAESATGLPYTITPRHKGAML